MTTKPIHMAKGIREDGAVSALCFQRPRAIDLTKASWTNRREAVSCEKCKALLPSLADRPATDENKGQPK